MNRPRMLGALAMLVSLAGCALLYLPTLSGGFLSDDYSVLGALYAWSEDNRLMSALLAKFGEGLDVPSHYYRPLTMMSFGANYVMAGANPLPWRLTNLAIHLASGALVFVIATQLDDRSVTRPLAAPLLAAAMFLAFPTNAEAVAWVSGRYDLLALAFMLATVACFQRSQRWSDGWSIAALATAACALASKESAALLPAFVLAIAIGRRWKDGVARALALGVRDAAPWLVLGAIYFALRAAIFGTPFRVYPGTSPVVALLTGGWLKPLASTGVWLDAAMPLPVVRVAFLATLVTLIVLGALGCLARRQTRGAWLALAVTAALSIVLLLPHVVALATNGEQGRLFYTTSALLALLCSLPWSSQSFAAASSLWRGCIVTLTIALLAFETALLRAAILPWTDAGAQATALIAALARNARTIPAGDYGLALVPDHIGNVPFGRNAQGGLVSPPAQAAGLSNRLVVQTPPDLPPWPEHIARGLVDALRRYPLSEVWAAMAQGRTATGEVPTHYFCWASTSRELFALPWQPEFAARDWLGAWRDALAHSPCNASSELGAF